MRNRFLALIALASTFSGLAFGAPQNAPSAASASSSASSGQFGPSAVWPIPSDFLRIAHAACDNANQSSSVSECFIGEMAKAGAPADAVTFSRALYKSSGQVGMMGEFKAFGPVGLAWIVYPLRANQNDGLLVLNGDPQFLDPDDLQKLDKAALQGDPLFVQWKKAAPKLEIFEGDRAGGAAQIQFARVWPDDKPGSQRFLFTYPLVDGCRACARSGFANYWWDFDAQGRFQGTKLLSVTRGAPPIKRNRTQHPGGPPAPAASAPPSEPGQTPPTEAPTPH